MAIAFTITEDIAKNITEDIVLQEEGITVQSLYDVIVDAAGNGDYTTIQGAIDDSHNSILVKSGSYTETVTASNDNSKLVIEPGTTVTGTFGITGSNVVVVFGSGSTLDGELDITTGTDNSVIFKNGVSVDNIDINTARNSISGGGLGTVVNAGTAMHGISTNSSGVDCLLDSITAQTTGGGGSGNDSFNIMGARNVMFGCKIIDSDDDGYRIAADDVALLFSVILDADDRAIYPSSNPRYRIIGNYVANAGGNGIRLDHDDGLAVGNINDGSFNLDSSPNDNVVVGNRTDGTISDGSTGSVVASNDETAF